MKRNTEKIPALILDNIRVPIDEVPYQLEGSAHEIIRDNLQKQLSVQHRRNSFDITAIALMMETASTSETLVNFYQTTRRNDPEDSHLHTRRCENLKSDRPSCIRRQTFSNAQTRNYEAVGLIYAQTLT
jgi:hypothetical protein